MQPLELVDKTRTVGAPADWVEELDGPCESLDVFDYTDGLTGIPFMRTAWKPTAAELEALNRGGRIWLDISGKIFPVIRIFADV